jgi:hypothetical protein
VVRISTPGCDVVFSKRIRLTILHEYYAYRKSENPPIVFCCAPDTHRTNEHANRPDQLQCAQTKLSMSRPFHDSLCFGAHWNGSGIAIWEDEVAIGMAVEVKQWAFLFWLGRWRRGLAGLRDGFGVELATRVESRVSITHRRVVQVWLRAAHVGDDTGGMWI